jgi:hypothetical protein
MYASASLFHIKINFRRKTKVLRKNKNSDEKYSDRLGISKKLVNNQFGNNILIFAKLSACCSSA